MKPDISAEQINAFIDNELALPEKDSMFAALEGNPELVHQLCALRAVKEMVNHGYAELPPANRKAKPHKPGIQTYCWSGALMLAMGLAFGWLARDWNDPVLPAAQAARAQWENIPGTNLAGVAADHRKIILHVDSAEPVKLKALLDNVDLLLAQQSKDKPVQLEVIANNYGVNLLRTDVTPYAARIEALTRQHANIRFVACGQTIHRLTAEGIKVDLLPQARIAPTAIGQIVYRLQHGWTYIKA